ncbi:GNAT family N-acetyltransferase [Haliovirga abyssi]|uniref:N-acetyltransferase n=1 Tax=Haliovirga abyssi TaxID=2996794 RepID=A0AAU9DVR9_9FUSO|nr:GNAT family N-acetyltransferase [Haliovirga abyssi]BDU50326.1 N-acetyltransferase [Haliovirga abyssi]
MIRDVKLEDSKAICDIYNYYIENTIITFELEKIDSKEMENRIKEISNKYCWIVFEEENEILGYAYIGLWKSREAYNRVSEVTVYLKKGYDRKGIGTKLLKELMNRAKKMENMHSLISVIAIPNEGSIKLHEKLGFTKAAYYKEVGYKFDNYIDVECLQYIL